MIKWLSTLALLFALAGCSGFSGWTPPLSSENSAYMQAKSIPPLKTPPGLEPQEFENIYPVPARSYPSNQKSVDVTPPGLVRS